MLACLKVRLETDPFVTCQQLKALVHSACATDISVRTVTNAIRRLQFTQKRTFRHVQKEGLEAQRRLFEKSLSTLSQEAVISIDETAFCFDMKPQMGYAPRGQRLRTLVHSKRQNKWMAVSNTRVVGYSLFRGSCNASKFAEFVGALDKGSCSTLLLDKRRLPQNKDRQAGHGRQRIDPCLPPPVFASVPAYRVCLQLPEGQVSSTALSCRC